MKYVRFLYNNSIQHGILDGDVVREISNSFFAEFELRSSEHHISEVRLLPPTNPTKVLCAGLNYRKHIEEMGEQVPEFPAYFIKSPTAIIGTNDDIICPQIAQRVEYEGELALVIKNTIKNIPPEEAMEHVFGYTCFNDVTDRPLIKLQGQLIRGKGFDTFGPVGPCIVTDLDPSRLTIRTYLNGELKQEGEISDLIFPIDYLIHYMSQCMTLYPGDIISTGSPPGTGPIKPGDIVEVAVKEIGTLRNRVKAEHDES